MCHNPYESLKNINSTAMEAAQSQKHIISSLVIHVNQKTRSWSWIISLVDKALIRLFFRIINHMTHLQVNNPLRCSIQWRRNNIRHLSKQKQFWFQYVIARDEGVLMMTHSSSSLHTFIQLWFNKARSTRIYCHDYCYPPWLFYYLCLTLTVFWFALKGSKHFHLNCKLKDNGNV